MPKYHYCERCGLEIPIHYLKNNRMFYNGWICVQCRCDHKHKEYQPAERYTNSPESYTCIECGADLPIPRPDYDAMAKED